MSQPEDFRSFDLRGIERILSSLASEDAMKIFISAKEGIKKSTQTMKELDLTQRRYYVHLNELIKAGLIERTGEVYQLTTLGTACYSLGEVLNTVLAHRDRLDLVDRLRRAKSISLEETKQILQTISSKGIVGYLRIADLIQPVKMIETYEDLVSELIARIRGAEKSVRLASHYTDTRVVEVILEAFERGIDLSFLGSGKRSAAEKFQMLRMLLTPKIGNLIAMFLKRGVRTRLSEFPFSFCIIDEKYTIIELPNPKTDDFYVGFSIQNEAFGQKLVKIFEDLYSKGKENPLIEHFKK